MTPQELLAVGNPVEALKSLQGVVRSKPADSALRVFLFQLLCVLGDWSRAMRQLQVCGTLDAGALAMVSTYREAISCEAVREAVFAGRTTPVVFGQPPTWMALLIQALQADAQGDSSGATALRSHALESAPASSGSCDGTDFEWIADADSRLGPVLEAVINGRYCWVPFCNLTSLQFEAPADLRDLVWTPAHLGLSNGGETVALIPTRYVETTTEGEPQALLARRTDWVALEQPEPTSPSTYYRGLGQRMFAFGDNEQGILQIRNLVFTPSGASAPA